MGLFGKKKNAEVIGTEGTKREVCSSGMETGAVKVLGSGCAKCQSLERAAVEALKELGMNPAVEHVTDFAVIAAYGVMRTPALVVGEKVVSSGRVLSKEEVKCLLLEENADACPDGIDKEKNL